MVDDGSVIEKRLHNMKNLYLKASQLIDDLPDSVPEKARTVLKDTILGDKDLKKLMDGIDSHRPPRIFLIGRTGVGKRSIRRMKWRLRDSKIQLSIRKVRKIRYKNRFNTIKVLS